MKKFLLLLFAAIFFIKANAQNFGLQVGPVASFFTRHQTAFGGELIGNFSLNENSAIGAGLHLLKFSDIDNLYAPVFGTFKFSIPSKKIIYFLHADAGYSIHNFNSSGIDSAGNGTVKFAFKNKGGFYYAAGAGLHFKKQNSPYLNIQYSVYHFKYFTQTNEYTYHENTNPNSLTVTAGFWFNTKK